MEKKVPDYVTVDNNLFWYFNMQILRCGPPPMNKAMAAHLEALEYTSEMQFQFWISFARSLTLTIALECTSDMQFHFWISFARSLKFNLDLDWLLLLSSIEEQTLYPGNLMSFSKV